MGGRGGVAAVGDSWLAKIMAAHLQTSHSTRCLTTVGGAATAATIVAVVIVVAAVAVVAVATAVAAPVAIEVTAAVAAATQSAAICTLQLARNLLQCGSSARQGRQCITHTHTPLYTRTHTH